MIKWPHKRLTRGRDRVNHTQKQLLAIPLYLVFLVGLILILLSLLIDDSMMNWLGGIGFIMIFLASLLLVILKA